MVLEQNILVPTAAKRLGIKLSTAKVIVSKFKKTGQVFEKLQDRQAREMAEEDQRKK